ncbi:MAG: VWA domain-containing protein [Verrucomicrobiota bacterium]
MVWQYPYVLLFAIFAIVALFLIDTRSSHPMSPTRRRWLLIIRSLGVILIVAALASPAWIVRSKQQAVVFVLDHSQSLGENGLQRVYDAFDEMRGKFGMGTKIGVVSAGRDGEVLAYPDQQLPEDPDVELMQADGAATDLASAVTLANAVFPAGVSRHVVLISDGQETEGSLEQAARAAAVTDIRIHALPITGEQRPDVRVTNLVSSQSRINEGATLDLTATVEASIAGDGKVRLFENGLEVDSRDVTLEVGQTQQLQFRRSPDKRNIYNYRVVIEGFEGRDAIPDNNEALSIVDVRGKPLLLYIEGEEGESKYLVQAMAREGIRIDVRGPNGIPNNLRELAGYDAIVFSDIAAHEIGEARMTAIRDYVDKLGGGFVMIGGPNSFGVGGYYRTPIEEILPVKLRGPDHEEHQSSALALVVDRSGSMSGQKIEICKSAAIATADLLEDMDYIGVYAFDSSVHTVVPMTRVNSTTAIANQISLLASGGGTNIYPGITTARADLNKVKAKIKHMIVLTDGQTSGEGYQTLAANCNAEGITISTVAVGSGAQVALLQAIAAAGGGKSYVTMDPNAITRIFTQDTMMHTGRLIREEPFQAELIEPHPMLRNWEDSAAPPLLGYVKTNRKATSQIPLVTDAGDPLLAHWRFGVGKVTAFTSDCKSRWGALWVSGWDGYSKIWAQILRETARPPQGRNMDLRLEEDGEETIAMVDLLEDAGSRRNDAQVEADIYFVPANALGSSMKLVATKALEQEGSGLYTTRFRPDNAGVYLVRARAGAQMVSAGHVHNPSGEVATGQINRELLRSATEVTGGKLLESAADEIELKGVADARYVELWPYLVMVFLALLIVDVAIRRWENLLGMVEVITGR